MNSIYEFELKIDNELKTFYLDENDKYSKKLKTKINTLTSMNGEKIEHNNKFIFKPKNKISFKKTRKITTKEEVKEGKLILHKFMELYYWKETPIISIIRYCELYDLEYEILEFEKYESLAQLEIIIDGVKIKYHKKYSHYRFHINNFEGFEIEENYLLDSDSIYQLNKKIGNKKLLEDKNKALKTVYELVEFEKVKNLESDTLLSYQEDKLIRFNEKVPNTLEVLKEFKEKEIEKINKEIQEEEERISKFKKEIFLENLNLSKKAEEIGFEIYLLHDPNVIYLIEENERIKGKEKEVLLLKKRNNSRIEHLRRLQDDKV